MTARDELENVNYVLVKYDQLPGSEFGVRGVLAELRADGWRKMPSAEALDALLARDLSEDEPEWSRIVIRKNILALMDGNTDE